MRERGHRAWPLVEIVVVAEASGEGAETVCLVVVVGQERSTSGLAEREPASDLHGVHKWVCACEKCGW